MPAIRDFPLVPASVPATASFRDAARELAAATVGAVAVLEGDAVVGLFTQDDLIGGLFPPYLEELRHSAFLKDDPDALRRSAWTTLDAPVVEHMREPVLVDAEASASHAAERFLHCEWGALAVVDDGRFLGMLTQLELVRSLAQELGLEA